jgi:hypothetical protein
LVSFEELGDEDNATGLCPTCHRNFDAPFDPGFVFLPEDLDYFVRFEKADQTRRRQEKAAHGIQLARLVPNAERYRLQQEQDGKVGSDAVGGQYRRYILQDFLPQGLREILHSSTREWHGSPAAAIQRGIRIVGHSPPGLPPTVRQQLRDLLALYEWDFSQYSPSNAPSPSESTSTDQNLESANRQHAYQDSVPQDDKARKQERVGREFSGTQGRGHEEGINKRKCSGADELQEEYYGPKRRMTREEWEYDSNRSEAPPESLPDLDNSKNEENSQDDSQEASIEHTWGRYMTSSDAIRFFTDISIIKG